MTPGEVIWAHHPLLFAIPAFVPAIIIAGVILSLSIKDRRAEAAEVAAATGDDGVGDGPDEDEAT